MLLDKGVSSEDFTRAMAAIRVGGVYKTTERDRHPECDDLLLANVDVTSLNILDIGASDGSTSLDLISRLPGFASYVVTDLYLSLTAVHVRSHLAFLLPSGECVLVSGRRCLAWPGLSKTVSFVYRPIVSAARRRRHGQEVLLVNPALRSLARSDSRVSYRSHDVFTPWTEGRPPDVIKVANLLRRLYFSDEDILRALDVLRQSLPDGGHLLIVDDPYLDVSSRAGLYRRAGDHYRLVAVTPEVPEINDLVLKGQADAREGRQEVNRRRPATRRATA